eukprot:16437810-Heterocapsa_arctica.AAC.2
MEPPFHGESNGQVAEAIAEGLRQQCMGCIGWYMKASTMVQLQWEVSLWEAVFPRAVEPQEELDEEFWLNLLEPEADLQPEVQILAIMDAPDGEAPIEDRPNPHAGVRIGEASNPARRQTVGS